MFDVRADNIGVTGQGISSGFVHAQGIEICLAFVESQPGCSTQGGSIRDGQNHVGCTTAHPGYKIAIGTCQAQYRAGVQGLVGICSTRLGLLGQLGSPGLVAQDTPVR